MRLPLCTASNRLEFLQWRRFWDWFTDVRDCSSLPFFYSSASLDRRQAKATLLISGIFGVVFRNSHPVLYGAMGFVSGAIGALLHNLFARCVGGFELEMDGGRRR